MTSNLIIYFLTVSVSALSSRVVNNEIDEKLRSDGYYRVDRKSSFLERFSNKAYHFIPVVNILVASHSLLYMKQNYDRLISDSRYIRNNSLNVVIKDNIDVVKTSRQEQLEMYHQVKRKLEKEKEHKNDLQYQVKNELNKLDKDIEDLTDEEKKELYNKVREFIKEETPKQKTKK